MITIPSRIVTADLYSLFHYGSSAFQQTATLLGSVPSTVDINE